MTNDNDDILKCWMVKRCSAIVLDFLPDTITVSEATRNHAPTVAESELWKERLLAGAENALKTRPLADEALKVQEIKRLK